MNQKSKPQEYWEILLLFIAVLACGSIAQSLFVIINNAQS